MIEKDDLLHFDFSFYRTVHPGVINITLYKVATLPPLGYSPQMLLLTCDQMTVPCHG